MGGQVARGLTTFDAAVYSLVLNLATHGQPPVHFDCQKIKKSNSELFATDELGMRLARLSFIAFGEKIRDDCLDGITVQAKTLKRLFGKIIENCRQSEPELAAIARRGTDEINLLQSQGADVESVLSVYGRAMADTFSLFSPLPDEAKDFYFALAEWTFFVDMLCDYDEDFKKGAPNSLRDESCPTLSRLFDVKYDLICGQNKRIADKLVKGLDALNDGSYEWEALYHIIIYALNNVVSGTLSGKDMSFHYFKEFFKNRKNMKISNDRTKKMQAENK